MFQSQAYIRKQQSHMKDVLDGKKVKYEEIDISSSSEDRDKMRELCGDPKALPPQIFRGNKYLGDYQAFANAVEDEKIEEFLSK
ncbi:SH3 domain-binding glutamic acid-rich-like protein 3 [Pomacea canaliculata]|nr:SH3 domain-binding glutamic acid-rich-like protein 3 [Pomacea canaliculata]